MFAISFRFLETVLASTFNLFSTSSDPEFGSSEMQFMTPLHFLALIDPRATWFKKWMVSSNNACLLQMEAGVQRTPDNASESLYLHDGGALHESCLVLQHMEHNQEPPTYPNANQSTLLI